MKLAYILVVLLVSTIIAAVNGLAITSTQECKIGCKEVRQQNILECRHGFVGDQKSCKLEYGSCMTTAKDTYSVNRTSDSRQKYLDDKAKCRETYQECRRSSLATANKCVDQAKEDYSACMLQCSIIVDDRTLPDDNKQFKCDTSSGIKKNCPSVYKPVCGWPGPEVQCITSPCANTYSNSCEACNSGFAETWTEGVCPKA